MQLRPYSVDAGDDVLTRNALELNQKPVYVIESAHNGELPPEKSYCITDKDTTAVISTIKRAEDNDGWIIRAVEAAGKNTSAEFNFVWLGFSQKFTFTPYEIKTIKIADNSGTAVETNLLEYNHV